MSIKSNWRVKAVTLIIIGVFSLTVTASANFKYEYQFAQGYTNNLFMDNSGTEDYNTGNKLLLTYYPTNKIKIEFQGYHTYYKNIIGLGNFAGTIDFTYLPIKKDSPFSLYLNGKVSPTIYSPSKMEFDNNSLEFKIGATYQTKSIGQLRAGFAVTSNIYTNDNEIGYNTLEREFLYPSDHAIYKMYAGSNSTLGHNSSLDLEFGLASMSLTYVFNPQNDPNVVNREDLSVFYDILQESHLLAYYFSPRISKSFGRKIGVNLTYTYRDFVNVDDVVLPGISTGFLSPWANVYAGEAITFSIKSFNIPNIILSTGIGYFDKQYIPSERARTENDPPSEYDAKYTIYQRNDWQAKTFLSAKRPIPFKSGMFMEPSLTINYSENKSNDILYRYTAISITLGLTVRF